MFPYENLSGTEEVFWTKNGERINTQESNEKYSGIRIDYPSLTIRKVNQQDAGSYQFTATNSMGTTKSDIIVLGKTFYLCNQTSWHFIDFHRHVNQNISC